MKCAACGYEKSKPWQNDDEVEKDDEDFIQIKGVDFKAKSEVYWDDDRVYLFACPKCSTVKMERFR